MDETVTKVSGTYHGVAFTGVVSGFTANFTMIKLDAPITVHGRTENDTIGMPNNEYNANVTETK